MKTQKTGFNKLPRSVITKRIQDLVWVFQNKNGIPGSPARVRLLQDADKIFLCERRKKKRKFGPKEPWFHRTCKHPCCPRCQHRLFVQNDRALVSQFTGCDPRRLHIITLSPGPHNVPGAKLSAAMKKMRDAFDHLCHLRPWRKIVKRCGGPQHRTWIPQGHPHGVGYRPHHQMVVLTRKEKPRWKPIAELHRQFLGLPKGTPMDSYFHAEPLDTLEGHSKYLMKTEQFLPGVDFDKPREEWELMNIPDEDVVAYIDAVKKKRHLYFRGIDSSRKPVKPIRKVRE